MMFTRQHTILLNSFVLFCVLCLLIGCSADEEIQSARLIEASAYYYRGLQELIVRPLPLNGREIISHSDTIELVFDKPVRQVSINEVNARPNQKPTGTIWLLETYRLEVWDNQEGFNPERDVTLEASHVSSPLPAIQEANISHKQTDADADQLNREGIRITFNTSIDSNDPGLKFTVVK